MVNALLAATVKLDDLQNLKYPVLASPKLDGIRCLIDPLMGPITRNGNVIANRSIRQRLCRFDLIHFDGEIICGDFRKTSSLVRSFHGEPTFTYHVFDHFAVPGDPFMRRIGNVIAPNYGLNNFEVECVQQTFCQNASDVMTLYQQFMGEGYEGIMLRDPNGWYKEKRSTLREGILLKYKEMKETEGIIIDIDPLVREDGTVEDLLGAVILRVPVIQENSTVRVGTGFTLLQRKKYWNERYNLIGKSVTFRYQPGDDYRFPSFRGLRDDI